MINTLLTPRIEACLEAGSIEDLKPRLAQWPQAELRALERDLRDSYEVSRAHLEARYREVVFGPYRPLPGELEDIHAQYQRVAAGLVEMYAELQEAVCANLKPEGSIQ